MKKPNSNLFKRILMAIFIIVCSNIFGQTTIVNNNFNSGTSYATLAPTLASNITCTATSTETFSTTTGIASGNSAFISNATAGKALTMTNSSGTNTRYWTFQLGGSSLSSYKNYKLYLQAQRNSTGAQKITIATSTNGSNYTNFATTMTVTTAFTEQVFDLSTVTAINNQSSVYIRIMASGASSTGTLGIDNFEILATMLCPTLTASLTGGSSPVCYNTAPTKFTATGTGGNGTYTYLWYKNGVSTGTTTQTYTTPALTANATIYCAVTSCGQTVNTSTYTVTVYNTLAASISGGTTPVCSGTSPGTFTAMATGGSGTYTYLWYKNSTSTGVTTQTYSPGNLTASTTIYCAVTSCGQTVNTTTYTVSIYGTFTASLTGGSSPICYNTAPAMFTATGTGGSGTFTYLWYKNGVSTGVTTKTYTAPALAANTTVYCAVTSCGKTVNTSTYTVTVYSNLTAAITGGSSPICYNTAPAKFTATGTGGSGTYAYLWYKNGVSTGITTQTYTAPALTANATIYCAVSCGCQTVNTSTYSVTVYGNLATSITGGTTPIASGTSPGTFTATATGGSGINTYLWYKNGTSTGITTQTYNPGNLTATTTIYCAVTSCSQTVNTATFTVNICGNITASISGGINPICSGSNPGTFTVTANGGSGSFTYLWYKNSVSTGITTKTYSPGILIASSSVYCAVTSGSCGTVNTPVVNITVNPLPVAEAGRDTSIYPGVSVTIGTPYVSGNTYSWSPSVGISNANASNPSAYPLTTTKYRLTVTNNLTGCSNHDSITISMKSNTPQFVSGNVNFRVSSASNAKIDYTTPPSEFASLIDKYHISSINKLFNTSDPVLSKIYTLKFDTIHSIDSLISDIKKISYIEYAEKVPLAYIYTAPNDPYYTSGQQYSLAITNAQQAWTLVSQNPLADAVIAIIDNQFMVANNVGELTHEDLADNLWNNPNPTMGDIHGYDFGNNDNTLSDPSSTSYHGTLVAGAADAKTNNGLGVASIGDWGETAITDHRARLMCLKYFQDGSSGGTANAMAQAMVYAVQNKANVINISGGSPFYPTTLPVVLPPVVITGIPGYNTMQDVVNYAHDANVLVVAAAGNYGNFVKTWPCSLENVICVGATDANDKITSFTNLGPQIDVMAPGNNLPGCWGPTTSSYSNESGTSISAPEVSGLAGLALIRFPYMPVEAIESCIENTSDNIDALNVFPVTTGSGGVIPSYSVALNTPNNIYQYNLGHGRINAGNAIQCLIDNVNSTTNKIGMLPSNPCPSAPVNLFYYSNDQILTYNWSISPSVTFVAPYSSSSRSPKIIFGNTGSYAVTLTVTTSSGTTVYNQVINILNNNLPTATISSSFTNMNPSCDGSSQSIDVQFTGTPPFNITLSDGATTKTFSNIDQFQSNLYWDVYLSNPIVTVTNITDHGTNQYCNNNGNAITFNNVVKCCSNKVDNGDFEAAIPSSSTDYPTSTSTGSVNFYSDYTYNPSLGINHIMISTDLITQPYSASFLCQSQHGHNALYCDGYCTQYCSGDPTPVAPADVWRSKIIPVNQNQDYYYSFWVNALWDYYTYVENATYFSPKIELFANGNQLNYGNLPGTPNYYYPVTQPERWYHLCGVWNSGSNTTVQIDIKDLTDNGGNGNDFAIDNIELRCIDNFNVVASNDIPICKGSNTQITATATGGVQPYTYNWGPATGLTSTTISNPVASPTSTTTYIVTATDANGCTSTDNVTVIVNTVTITTNPSSSICVGSSVTLSATGGGTYLWSNSNTTSSITVSPAVTTNYTVTVTGTNGCTATGPVTITVNQPPATYTGLDQSICYGSSVPIGPGGHYINTSFSWSPATGLSCPNCQQPTASPTTTTTYTLTVTNTLTGCSSTDNVTVTVNPLPTVFYFTGGGSYCTGSTGASATLSGSQIGVNYQLQLGGVNYGVVYPGTGGVMSGFIANPGTYTVIATDATTGCSVAMNGSVIVTLGSTPTITINGQAPNPPIIMSYMLCSGNSITLTAGGATSYVWSNGSTSSSIIVTPTSATTYVVTGTSGSGCSNTASVEVLVINKPTVTISDSIDPICSGGSTTLTAGGAMVYTWSNGSTVNPLVVSPTSTTTYTVTGTNLSCYSIASVTVTVNPKPIVTINGQAPSPPFSFGFTMCAGNSATLTAGGASSYLWSNGLTASSISVSPTSAATYSVTGTDGGCTNAASVSILVLSKPTVTISDSIGTICVGGSTTLTAGGANSYSWSNGTTANPLVVSPTSTTTYTVTGSSMFGCTNTASYTVTVNPLPSANAGPDQTICAGSSATLGNSTLVPFISYAWSPSTGLNATNVKNPVATPSVTTTYTVIITNMLTGCSASDNVVITVNPKPTVTVNGAAPPLSESFLLCPGGSATFTAGGASTYSWSNGATTTSISVSPASSTTYTVTGTDGNGCTNIAYGSLSIMSNPTINISDSLNTICAGGSTTLTAGGGFSYSWNTGSTSNPLVVSPASTTTYTVTGTSLIGCHNTASFTVTVNPLPSANAGPDQTICAGSSATLGNSTLVPFISYAWSPSTGLNATNVKNPVATPSITTTYTVIITNMLTGCSASDNVVITVNPAQSANAGADQTICAGKSVLIGPAGHYINVSFSWSPAVGLSCTNCQQPNASPSVTTTYILTEANTTTGCSSTDTMTVFVNPLPSANAGPNKSICAGQSVTIGTLILTKATTYAWSPATGLSCTNCQQPTATPTATTTYTLTVTNNLTGCSSTSSVTVTVNPLPTVYYFTGGGTYCTGGLGAMAYLSGSQLGVDYQLQLSGVNFGVPHPGTGAASSGYIKNPGTYTMVATDSITGCSSTMSGTITVTEIDCGSKGTTLVNDSSGSEVSNDQGKLTVFPNPATSKISYEFYSGNNEEYSLKVIDIAGKEIITNIVNATEGNNLNSLDLSTLKPALYLLVLTSKDKLYKSYIIKQ